MAKSPFLLSISQDMRQKGYSLRTEKTYIHWIKRFILFHGKRHPLEMAGEEVRLFLSHLANAENVSINTQKTALNALATPSAMTSIKLCEPILFLPTHLSIFPITASIPTIRVGNTGFHPKGTPTTPGSNTSSASSLSRALQDLC